REAPARAGKTEEERREGRQEARPARGGEGRYARVRRRIRVSDAGASGSSARIWVDADACPGPIREILFRAAERTGVQVTLIANQWLRTPPSRHIRALQVQ